jgi:hypothetical protein
MGLKKDWHCGIWVSASEAARLEGLDERTIRSRFREGAPGWRRGENGDKEIQLSFLSRRATDKYEEEELPEAEPLPKREDPESFLQLFHASTSYAQKTCVQWTNVLLSCCGLRGSGNLQAFVGWWNRSNKFQISLPNLYKRLKEYRASGGDRSFLLKERYVPKSTIKKEWLADFKDCYLRQQRPSAADCRLYALGKARMRGENVDEDSFPGLASWYRAAAKIQAGIKSWHRNGPKNFNDTQGFYISRDWSKTPAGLCWIGDTRTWDIMVRCPGFESLKRPYITMFVDGRTDMPMGWHIHFTAPSAANTLTALRNGIKHHGLPSRLQVDNGREYRNRDFSGNPRGGNNWGTENDKDGEYWMTSAASLLHIQMKFAIKGNAQTKTVENSFGVYKKIIDKSFLSYFGGNSVERPEQVKEFFKSKNKDKVIEFSEFKNLVDRFLINVIPNLKCKSKRFEQDTRQKAWDFLYAQRADKMKFLDEEALSMIPTLTEECTIGRNGTTIAKLGVSWHAEWMSLIKGSKIIIRYNPQDLSKAWGYEKNGRIIGEMGRPHILPAYIEDLPEEEQELTKEALGKAMALKRGEKKLAKNSHESKRISEREILEAMEAAVGANGAKIAALPKPTVATKHNADMEKLRKDYERGDPGILDRMLG